MSRQHLATTIILSVAALSLTSCSGESSREAAARKLGVADADTFISIASQKKVTRMRLQGFLLDVRDKENRLRNAGETKAADIYVSSFEGHLQDSVPELFMQISAKDQTNQ